MRSYDYTAYIVHGDRGWVVSLDLCWLDGGEYHDAGDMIGWVEVFGSTRYAAAKAFVAFMQTLDAGCTVWLLDENERDYCTVSFEKGEKPHITIPGYDRNHGRGATAWQEVKVG